MANTLKFGNGEWYGKKDTILAYNDENSNYKPLPFDFSRASKATVINKDGLIEEVGSGQPRIDYKDDSKGALKLEPTRSNLIQYSEDFSDAYWIKSGVSVVDGFLSPKGDLSAYKLIESNTNSKHQVYRANAFASSTEYTYSFFAKKGERNFVSYIFSGVTNTASVYFDLENGVIGSTNAVPSMTLINQSIEPYGNDWFRCSLTFTQSVNTSISITVSDQDYGASVPTYQGDGTSGVYIWGVQLEVGSYPTSYIPTSGSAVTRLADVCNNGGNEQVINSTEGVLYVEANLIDGYDNNNWLGIIYDNSNANNRVYIQRYLGNIQGGIRVNGVIQSEITQSNSSLGKNKIAFSYKLNEFKLFINGLQVGITDTSGSVFSANTLNTLNVGVYHNNTLQFNSGIDDVRLYNTALTDQELAALTQV